MQAEKRVYTYCPHGRVKELVVCRQCCEVALALTYECVTMDKKAKKRLGTKIPCEHGGERRRCKICVGSWICKHGKNKVYCAECDGHRLLASRARRDPAALLRDVQEVQAKGGLVWLGRAYLILF